MKYSDSKPQNKGDFSDMNDAERGSMRLAIAQYQGAHPLQAPGFVWGRSIFLRIGTPVLAAMLLCATSAYAAQGTVPGDLLYPVKINVTEPIQVALATNPEAKATVEAKLAENRVTEAQTLAARGTLNATTTRELEESFNVHAAQAIALADDSASTTVLAEAVTGTALPVASTTTMHVTFAAATSSATTTPMTHPTMQKGFSVELRASLHAQAGVFMILQSHLSSTTASYINVDAEATSSEAVSATSSAPQLPSLQSY